MSEDSVVQINRPSAYSAGVERTEPCLSGTKDEVRTYVKDDKHAASKSSPSVEKTWPSCDVDKFNGKF
jgi:hypothetical protein